MFDLNLVSICINGIYPVLISLYIFNRTIKSYDQFNYILNCKALCLSASVVWVTQPINKLNQLVYQLIGHDISAAITNSKYIKIRVFNWRIKNFNNLKKSKSLNKYLTNILKSKIILF